MLNLLRMCLLNVLDMLIVLLWRFDKDRFLSRYHPQKMWRCCQSQSKGHRLSVRFALYYFLTSAIPPPILSLYDEFVKRTAPPVIEQPINKNNNRYIKTLFIYSPSILKIC